MSTTYQKWLTNENLSNYMVISLVDRPIKSIYKAKAIQNACQEKKKEE